VRVIVTANGDFSQQGNQHIAAAVGIAQNVTNAGFDLRIRNSDCAAGLVAFNWMAVLETPGVNQPPAAVRMAILPHQPFQNTCTPGDTPPDVTAPFWKPFASTPTVFLTAGNLFVRFAAPAVGIALNQQLNSFTLRARNSGILGDCMFYYAAVGQDPLGGGSNQNLFVDTGVVSAMGFNSTFVPGDTQSLPIFFNEPFLTPPIVLLTANNVDATGHIAAPVGLAQDVTPYGFNLVARNSDCAPGMAGLYWVALGCGLGCG
jgi:hypothetical protein